MNDFAVWWLQYARTTLKCPLVSTAYDVRIWRTVDLSTVPHCSEMQCRVSCTRFTLKFAVDENAGVLGSDWRRSSVWCRRMALLVRSRHSG